MGYRRMVWLVATHVLVAVMAFTAAYYAFAGLALGAVINGCGTDTDYLVARNAAGEQVGMFDSVCGFLLPFHIVQIYRVSADRKQSEPVLHYSTNIFRAPHASWAPQGELVIDVPRARSLSTDPQVKRSVTFKFGRIL